MFTTFSRTIVKSSIDFLTFPDLHHPRLDILLTIKPEQSKLTFESQSYDFRKGNYTDMCQFLFNINCCDLANMKLDIAVKTFYSYLQSALDKFVPKKHHRSNHAFPPWFTLNLKNLIADQKNAHKIYKSTGLMNGYLTFSNLRAR